MTWSVVLYTKIEGCGWRVFLAAFCCFLVIVLLRRKVSFFFSLGARLGQRQSTAHKNRDDGAGQQSRRTVLSLWRARQTLAGADDTAGACNGRRRHRPSHHRNTRPIDPNRPADIVAKKGVKTAGFGIAMPSPARRAGRNCPAP
ncbi:hypothetical protein TW95_gp1243 [Pandoravirus inopinatum]|uniref:Uncharacterized protein n=1 Tax=Pandoravirus inopinatum TaxID=1605721 RepID=A0A0B5JDY9_9VIRU|nr:hypothetical protein TW95_gp1243 [Pandoravirus inopinatum]AJF97977.1 hypothetical protein [Pandoravirus inopinatum]